MFSEIKTAGTYGIDGFKVSVEPDISKGMPGITIVGLPAVAVKESKDRIKSAITNSFFNYPITKKIVINLSPADIKKEGSHYDLPIALAIMSENVKMNEEKIRTTAFLGELSLDGKLKKIKASTALILGLLKDENIRNVVIPRTNEKEATMIPDINIFIADDINQVIEYLQDERELPLVGDFKDFNPVEIKRDFSDVKGSFTVKRAAQISAAGFHNLMMIGSPGSGKTMIASRMNTIMPLLNEDEYIEVSKIYSFLDIVLRNRPFRSPHHTITYTSLIGGGSMAVPGEVVLAHGGILFMDEFLNFDKKLIQGLRQPIEDKFITISRVNYKLTYPSNFLLVCATNPCPCGNFLNPQKECTCSEKKIHDYLQKVSAPMLDRIDIFVETSPIPYDDLTNTNIKELSSEKLRQGVNKAINIQNQRFNGLDINYNSQMGVKEIEKYCILDEDAEKLVSLFFNSAKLTARSYHRLLKVARTISDMDESEIIRQNHIAEAINFRKTFSKYFEKI